MKALAVALPKGIDIEGLVGVYSSSLEVNYTKYLVSKILKKQSFSRSVKMHSDGFVGFSSENALTTYNKHKNHLKLLCSDILFVKRRKSTTRYENGKIPLLYRKPYKVGRYPFRYKLNDFFEHQELKVDFIDNFKLIKKILTKEMKLPKIFTTGRFKFLKKFFNDKLLSIDLEKAIDLCWNRYLEHKDYFKYVKEFNQVLDIYNGNYKVYFNNKTDNRLHTNITLLPKVYRELLLYNNKELIEVDISNSIIYFLSVILNNNLDNKLINNNPSLLMFLKSLEQVDYKEIQLFTKIAMNGCFYNFFIPEFEENYSELELRFIYSLENNDSFKGGYEQKRKIAKKMLLAMIFAKPNQYLKVQNIFKKHFPVLLGRINSFKEKQGYKELSKILLQVESYYILDVLAREFNRKHYRNAPVFSLHDCLITTLDYKGELEHTVNNVLKENIGYAPRF